jgi:hypothetical protein
VGNVRRIVTLWRYLLSAMSLAMLLYFAEILIVPTLRAFYSQSTVILSRDYSNSSLHCLRLDDQSSITSVIAASSIYSCSDDHLRTMLLYLILQGRRQHRRLVRGILGKSRLTPLCITITTVSPVSFSRRHRRIVGLRRSM